MSLYDDYESVLILSVTLEIDSSLILFGVVVFICWAIVYS